MPSQNGILSYSSQLLEKKTDSLETNESIVSHQCDNQFNHINRRAATEANSNDHIVNNRQLRILICTESFHPYTSGIARRFKEIIGRLARRGFLIHIITGCRGCETWSDDSYYKDKVTFSRLTSIEFKDKIDCNLPFLLPTIGFLQAILTFKPDIVHCVEHTPSSTFCGALAAFFDIPTVWSSHTNLDYYLPLYIHPISARTSVWIYQSLRRLFLNLADYNLTVSSDFAQLLNENGIEKCVHVWKTGVDSELFNPSYRSEQMRIRMFNGNYSPDKILLVSVGRLSPEKHFDFLLNILERFPNVFLCIVGGGPYKECLEPLFPPHQAYFMGFLQGEELASAYASGDYFVYASISETFGQVYLEAMSSGTPVVAAEGQQMKEFFVNGVHGFTWKPHDVESACKAMQDAMSCDRNTLSKNCRQTALQHSWNNAATQIERVYSDLDTSKIKRSSSQRSLAGKAINYLKNKAFGVWVLMRWLGLMILVVTCMLPFMKVFKPTKQEASNNSEKAIENEKSQTSPRRQVRRRRGSSKRSRSSRQGARNSSASRSRDTSQHNDEQPKESSTQKTSFVQSRLDCVQNCFYSLVTRSTTLIISLACVTALFALCFNTNGFI